MAAADLFCMNHYDCIGFDMDHTFVQYNKPQMLQLVYESVTSYLIKEKSYSEEVLLADGFTKYQDFCVRGIIFDFTKGNFIKLGKDGIVMSCSHGFTVMTDEEIKSDYGKTKKWPMFSELKEKVHNGDDYVLIEGFIFMPVAVILAMLVQDADKENGCRLNNYKPIWADVVESFRINFIHTSFKEEKGMFFPSMKNDVAKYVKRTPKKVIDWVRNLRKAGKVTFLATDSYADFADCMLQYAVGENWKELFDYICCYVSKPKFFQEAFKERAFLPVNGNFEMGDNAVNVLNIHSIYAQGHANILEENIQKRTDTDKLQVLYVGDSMKGDVFPTRKHMGWHSVALLQEMEAEGNCNSSYENVLQDDEKLLLRSNQWGSFFSNTSADMHGNTVTFWMSLLQQYSKLAVPSLNHLSGSMNKDIPKSFKPGNKNTKPMLSYQAPEREISLEEINPCFSANSSGFYPFTPKSMNNSAAGVV